MKVNKMQVGVWVFIVLVIISIGAFVRLKKYPLSENTISGKVINVVDRPNMAEDGYYGITVQTSDMQEYTVDATGYLNTPVMPAERGQTCVDVPKVRTGDYVIFNLPKAEGRDNTFVICYDKKVPAYGHFFRIELGLNNHP